MVRIGEQAIVSSLSGMCPFAMDVKAPVSNSKAFVIPTADNGRVAVKALNVYEQDVGLVIPLPCGSRAFLPSEPPDYYRNTDLGMGGLGCNCSQGPPETDGWACASNCQFRKELGVCKISLGYAQNIYDPNFCSHEIGRGYWYGNEYIKQTTQYFGCGRSSCPQYYLGWDDVKKVHVYCSSIASATGTVIKDEFGNIVSDTRGGCPNISGMVVTGEERRKGYACSRTITCPYYNGGGGTKMCTHGPSSPPAFQPGIKPSTCQNPAGLQFLGWDVPGGSASTGISCPFTKATEGNSGTIEKTSAFGDEKIQCVFSVS